MIGYGIDVSHHQAPASVPWSAIAERSSFAICRTTYGTMRDRQVAAHVSHARAVGLDVGVYHFFRPSQPWQAQLEVFRAAAGAAGFGAGDIVPVLDVELDPLPKGQARPVTPAWQKPVRALLEAFEAEFGGAMVYITQREFHGLGAPAWLLSFPLWVAHYTGASKPATPSKAPATIWQHRVGPYNPDGSGGYFEGEGALQLDQNRLLGDLPMAMTTPAATETTAETFDDDAELEELCARAFALQFDTLDIVHDEGLRELRELEPDPNGGNG